MNVNAIIIDDEEKNIENLRHLIMHYCKKVTVVGIAKNADEGYAVISSLQPDLVFLDIEMPGKSGMELLKSLPNLSFEIIFVTAHSQYGIQAIKFAAIDYLLKPINVEELKDAVNKAVEKRLQKTQNLQLENLIQLLKQQQIKSEHRIALPTVKETRFAKTDDILRCESSNNYTIFYFISGEKMIVATPIYEYEEMLEPYDFIRCHQSHLVNKKYIKSWMKEDGGYLLLTDQTQVPVSRQKKETLKALFMG